VDGKEDKEEEDETERERKVDEGTHRCQKRETKGEDVSWCVIKHDAGKHLQHGRILLCARRGGKS